MAVATRWLIDKSAYVRLPLAADPDLWFQRIEQGVVSVSTLTLLELGFSVRSASDWRLGVRQPPVSKLLVESLTPVMEDRALEIQGQLASRGHHRAAKVPDLLIAAIAERARLTVLHVDKDFDLIAEVTGQPVERLVGVF